MKKKIFVITFTLLIGLCLVIVFNNYGQTDNEKASIEKILKECVADIIKWENTAKILIFLTIVVGVLGVVTGILQRYRNNWCRIASMIAGAVISIIIVVNNTAFKFDYRTLLSRAQQARQLVNDIRIEITRGYPEGNEEARNEWFNKIQEKLHKIPELSADNYAANISINLVSTAYAQSSEEITQEPSWISKPPKDKINLFFVGIGDSSSLKKAKIYSLKDAFIGAIYYLTSQFEIQRGVESVKFDIKALSEYLAKSAEVEDIYFHYNRDNDSYRYYMLLKLNKRNAKLDIKLFKVQEKVYIPQEFKDAIENPRESPEAYYMQRMSTRDNFLDLAKSKLSISQYEKFIEGRLLREEGSYERTIELLEQVIKQNPTFYFGWYDLALAYDALNDFSQANRAFKRAAELEHKQQMRDTSFYTTYGDFLCRHKKYEEAIVQLKKALDIDPGYAKAKNTLKKAEKAIR